MGRARFIGRSCAESGQGGYSTVSDLSWEEFAYQYLETGGFDFEDRPKTTKVMRRLRDRLPPEVWNEIPSLIVFAPCSWKLGEVHPSGVRRVENAAFIYL